MNDVNNYVRYSDCIEVDILKMDTKIYDDIDSMIKEEDSRSTTTVLLNNFSDEIDAYYFSSSSSFTAGYCSVYRKTHSQNYFDYVCTLYNSINFIDYKIHNKDNYDYLAVISIPKSDGTYSYMLYENKDIGNEKIYAKTDWNDWSICNIEETEEEGIYSKVGNTWILGLNLESENITQNLSVTSWDTLGKYPKISVGERDYASSMVSCLLGKMEEVTVDDDGNKAYKYTERNNMNARLPDKATNNTKQRIFKDSVYSRENEKFIRWQEFCSDGQLKLLKDIKGNAWIVQISSAPDTSFNVQTLGAPATISFNWVEVMGLDDISIIAEDK